MSKLIKLLQDRIKEMNTAVQSAKGALDEAQRHYLAVKSQADAYEVALQAERQNATSPVRTKGKKSPLEKPKAEMAPQLPLPNLLPGRKSGVRHAIVKLLWDEKHSLRANVVYDKLKGDGFSRKSVWRGLARLEDLGVLRRLGYGTYELKNGDAKTPATQ